MNRRFNLKSILGVISQGLGAMLAYVISLMITNMLVPLMPRIMAAAPPSGFLSTPMALLFNAAVNALILVWAARRSSFNGLAMVGQLFALSFGTQVVETQIETGYFLSAFPLLHDNFEVYILVLRGLATSLLFSLLVASIAGGFSKKPRLRPAFSTTTDIAVKQGAWLPAVYVALYMLFGYFVAWQSKELRLFYRGPAELNGFFEQWGLSLMQKPELPVFQYFRGILWMLCLLPLFLGFTGKRAELLIISTLALGLLPTAQLAYANPLMPPAVCMGHFWEVSISTGIFGFLCARFVPKPIQNGSFTS
jgi:hypothetical protein